MQRVYCITHSDNRKAPRRRARGFSCAALDGGGAGLEGVQQMPGGADAVFFDELAQDVGEDAAVEVVVYSWSSGSEGGWL